MFGEKIKQLREEKRFSVRKLAKLAGLSKTTISDIENNHNPNPTRETIEKLANALEVPAGLLLEEESSLQDISEEVYKKAEFKGYLNDLPEEEKLQMIKDLVAQEPKVIYQLSQNDNYIGPLTPDEYTALSVYLELYRKGKER